MGKLIDLCNWLSDEGVFLFDRQLPFSREETKALTIRLNAGDTWGIFLDGGRLETDAEKTVAAYHEGGHYATGTTHEITSPLDLIEKHEYKADKWAVEHLITQEELDEAVAAGYCELWQLSEYFGVTEEFMQKAVCWYVHGNLAAELYF